MTELSDELLVAYVDGQLERKQSRAVERVLEQDDVIARRVYALKNAHSRLEAAFEAILAGEEAIVAPPEPQRPGIFVTWASAAKLGLAGAGFVAALVFCLGIVVGRGLPAPWIGLAIVIAISNTLLELFSPRGTDDVTMASTNAAICWAFGALVL